ncbi:MAG: response regulator [Deltaproteobacteria bacterium]|nr:response regulator [Deltaproteobacteria bacterium]
MKIIGINGRNRQHRPGHPTILVVDDDAGIRDALECALCEEYNIIAISSARDALNSLRRGRFHLAIVDIVLKTFDGIKLATTIKRQYAIPVIILTAYSTEERAIKSLKAHVDDYIRKPFELEGLIDAIKRHLHFPDPTNYPGLAREYIHKNYKREAIQLSDISNHLNISKEHLIRLFKKAHGITPMAYLRQYRIKRAEELLHATRLPIYKILEEIGIVESSRSHFTRQFKRYTSMSPSHYRKTL